ncbi:MFS transporter [Streptomyces sp. NPDC006510]|uniref:MFS transporter n=1 Tax=Streptomyces sp. NPDC006510 TaxID=3155600 RepID=UPI0033B7EB38
MPVYGFIQDKLGLRKNLLYWAGGLVLLPLYIYVCGPLGLWAASGSAAISVCLLVTIRVTDRRRAAAVDHAASSVTVADVKSLLTYPAFWGCCCSSSR